MIVSSRKIIGQMLLQGKPFLSDNANQTVLAALNVASQESARYVGGCVRNSLLGLDVHDIDIATKLLPNEVIEHLDARGIRHVPTGIEHGTITAIVENCAIEITTLRKDTETDGRRSKVEFTDDWFQDAQRRDFTCNALYCDAQGNVFDPLTTGIADTMAQKIAFVGCASDRIKEDYLRILRFFRFFAWYGKGEIDSEGMLACALLKDGLNNLSAERVWSEAKKLMKAPAPFKALEQMEKIGILAQIFGEHLDFAKFKALSTLEFEQGLAPDPILRIMALLVRADQNRECLLCNKFRLSNAEKERIITWARDFTQINADLSAQAIKRNIYKMGATVFQDRVVLEWALDNSIQTYSKWNSMFKLSHELVLPVFPIGGAQIMALGIKKGPKIGQILDALEDWWVNNDFLIDKALIDAQIAIEIAKLN